MIAGGSKCAFAGGEHGPCQGRIQWHHVYPKARLKKQFKYGAVWSSLDGRYVAVNRHYPTTISGHVALDEILADPRNRMWLCAEGHHEPVTNHRIQPPVPESVWDFCSAFGLTAELENDIARAA